MEVIGVIIIILLVVIIVSGMNRTRAMGEFSNDIKSIVFRLKNLETTFNNHVYRPDKLDESTADAETGKTETTEKEDEEYPWYPTESESVPAPEISPAARKLAACLKKSDEVVETPADQPEPAPKQVTPPALPPIPVMQKTEKTPEPQKEIDAKTFFDKEPEVKPETETEPEIEIKTKPIFKDDTKSDRYGIDEIPNIEPIEREKSEFEKKALDVLHNIWMWIIVGDDYRRKDISREYAIASTWLVRAAIIILLAGSAFFLKYSIDNNLVAPGVRVAICAACAIGLLVFSLKLIGKDKKYDLIGRGLGGGALALLYFSVHSAANMYKLVDHTTGFILMVLITATAWIVSVRKNVMLMAIFGIVGGYMTPIILRTGEKNLYGLFAYMLLLGIGTLLISRHRDWKLLNWLSYTFTYTIFFMTLYKFYGKPVEAGVADYIPTMIFSSCYFVLFSCMALTFNIHNKKPATLLELYTLLANTAIFLGTSWIYTIKHFDRSWVACYSLGATAFFLLHLTWFLRKRFKDRNITFMLIGLSAFCLVLTFPLALSGVWITAAWAATAVLFLYLGLRIGSRFLLTSSYLVYFITAWRVFFFDYTGMKRTLEAGQYWSELIDHLLSGGMLCAAFIVGYKLLKRYGDDMPRGIVPSSNDLPVTASPGKVGYLFMWIGVVIAFIFFNVEIPNFARIFQPALRDPMTALLWAGTLIFMIRMTKKENGGWLGIVIAVFTIVLSLKLLFFDLNAWHFSTRLWVYGSEFSLLETALRTVGFAGVLFALLFGFKTVEVKDTLQLRKFFGILALIQLFIFLTLELSSGLHYFTPNFRPGGISILWGVFAFCMLWGGIRKDIKGLRYAGLILFAVDVFKIFFNDMKDLSQLSKIIAFIILGLVFLAGGFIYIKFREQFSLETANEPEELEE